MFTAQVIGETIMLQSGEIVKILSTSFNGDMTVINNRGAQRIHTADTRLWDRQQNEEYVNHLVNNLGYSKDEAISELLYMLDME